MDKLQELQERVEFLEKENEYLKSLLDKAGILYASTERAPVDLYEPDQGVNPPKIALIIKDSLTNLIRLVRLT